MKRIEPEREKLQFFYDGQIEVSGVLNTEIKEAGENARDKVYELENEKAFAFFYLTCSILCSEFTPISDSSTSTFEPNNYTIEDRREASRIARNKLTSNYEHQLISQIREKVKMESSEKDDQLMYASMLTSFDPSQYYQELFSRLRCSLLSTNLL